MNKTSHKGKIIVIGLQRTGTTSIGEALLQLGYSVLGTPSEPEIATALLSNNAQPAILKAQPYDALQDLPWAMLYKELDSAYPESKFILLKRPEASWLKSMLDHFGHSSTNMRKWAYGAGTPTNNEHLYSSAFQRHYREVKQYFANRPDDLLELSLVEGDGWEKLCRFLNRPIPKKPFPRSNKSKRNYTLTDNLSTLLRRIIPASWRIKILIFLRGEDRRNRFNNFPDSER